MNIESPAGGGASALGSTRLRLEEQNRELKRQIAQHMAPRYARATFCTDGNFRELQEAMKLAEQEEKRKEREEKVKEKEKENEKGE